MPVLLEHFVFYDVFIGTITHGSAVTSSSAIASAAPRLPPVVPRGTGLAGSVGGGEAGKDRRTDLLSKLELAKLDAQLQQGAKWREKEYSGMPFPVLPRRIRTDRKDGKGYFAQHPQFANHWYEVNPEGNVFGFTEIEAVKEGEEYILHDKSTPRRADVFVRLLVGVRIETGASKSGPWTSGSLLKPCDAADGCVFIADYGKKGRKVHKFKGGAVEEIADGQVWAESNADSGPALFWFGHLHEDAKRVVAWDASRDIWVMIKPPPPVVGQPPMSPRELSTATILLAIGGSQQQIGNDKWAPWMLLGQPCDPALTCLAARKRLDAKFKQEKAGPPLHMVFNVDSNPKYQWLVQFFSFWWHQSQDKKKGSTFTRLLTADGPDGLMDKIPTFLCKPPRELLSQDAYVPYNKITSVMQWIQAKHAELPADQIVVIMDVDVVLLEDISYFAMNVKKGQPLGTKGFMSFTGEDTPMDRMIKRYCKGCDAADPLAVPYFIHKDDLLKLAPRWLQKAREIRADTVPWGLVRDWRADKAVQLGWTAEQWAYLLAAAELGLRHEVRDDMSAFTGCGVLQLQEPMIHFSDWTKGLGKSGVEEKWNKGRLDAVAGIPNVDPKNKCEIDRVMIQKLQEARAAIFPHLKPAWAEK